MVIKDLSQTPFEEIVNCFLQAFEGYFVKMPPGVEHYRTRWKAAKVNYHFSYGIFDNQHLVGFLLHGVDKLDGKLTAFNAATGVLPKYRGQKLVKKMYTHAIPLLTQEGFKQSLLEVITENTAAIKAYQSVGFEKVKTYKCYTGSLQQSPLSKVGVLEKKMDSELWSKFPNQNLYSWENRKEAIENANYSYFQVHNKQVLESFFIINPGTGYVPQCDILVEEDAAWQRLFSAIATVCTTVKINNVDARFIQKNKHLLANGLQNHINQYEMKLDLNSL